MKKILLSVMMILIVVGGTVYADTSDHVACSDDQLAKCEQQEMTKEAFIEGLEAKGISVEDYKIMVKDKYEDLAASKGMTLEAYKLAVMEAKSVKADHCGKHK